MPAGHAFVVPRKRVAGAPELAVWKASAARADVVSFVASLADSVRGTPLSAPLPASPAVDALVGLLDTLSARALQGGREEGC